MVYGVADTPVLAHDVLVTPAEKRLRSGQPNILPVPIDIPLPVPHPDRCQPMFEFPGAVELRVDAHLAGFVDVAVFTADPHQTQPVGELARAFKLRVDGNLAIVIDVAVAATHADQRSEER